jgi:hypothetical protein
LTLRPLMYRFSDAGKGDPPRAPAAGVRKAPRHEIEVGWAPGGAAGSICGGARAQARFHRIAQHKSLAEQAGERDFNPVEPMRGCAEALEERGAGTESQNSGGPLGCHLARRLSSHCASFIYSAARLTTSGAVA